MNKNLREFFNREKEITTGSRADFEFILKSMGTKQEKFKKISPYQRYFLTFTSLAAVVVLTFVFTNNFNKTNNFTVAENSTVASVSARNIVQPQTMMLKTAVPPDATMDTSANFNDNITENSGVVPTSLVQQKTVWRNIVDYITNLFK